MHNNQSCQDTPQVVPYAQYDAARRDAIMWQERYNKLAAYKRYVQGVCALPDKECPPADKIAAIVAPTYYASIKTPANDDGCKPIYFPKYAELTGVPVDDQGRVAKRLGQSLQRLSDRGAITRQSFTPTDEQGNKMYGTKRVAIGVNPAFYAKPREAFHCPPEQVSKNGGHRETCPHCGSDQLVERVICKGCGAVLSEKTVNPAEQDTEPMPVVHVHEPEPTTMQGWMAGKGIEVVHEPVPNPDTPLPEPVAMHTPHCYKHGRDKRQVGFGWHCPVCEPAFGM